jgi:hypothetical protein
VCIDIAAIGNSFASRIGPKNLAPKSSLRAMQQLPNHNDQSIQDGSGSNSLNQIL